MSKPIEPIVIFVCLAITLASLVIASIKADINYIITGFATIISIITCYIAYQQYDTKKAQIRLHLYDRRYSVYEKIRQLLVVVRSSGYASDEDIYEFWRDTKHAEFLFDDDVNKYIDEIYKRSNNLLSHFQELERMEKGAQNSNLEELLRKSKVEFDWLNAQEDKVTENFKKYMDLGKIH